MRFVLTVVAFLIAIYAHGQLSIKSAVFSTEQLVDSASTTIDSLARSFNLRSTHQGDPTKEVIHSLDSLRGRLLVGCDTLRAIEQQIYEYTTKLDSINQKLNTIISPDQRVLGNFDFDPELKQGPRPTKVVDIRPTVQQLTNPSISVPNGMPNVQGWTLLNNLKIEGVVGKELEEAQTEIGVLSGFTRQIDAHRASIPSILPDNMSDMNHLSQALEERAADLLEKNNALETAGQSNSLLQAVKDQDAIKKHMIEQVQEAAVDHFADKQKELQNAMETISKLKKKYASLNSLAEIPKKRPNELRGKPLVERLLPGIGIQIQKKNDYVLTDFNLYLGYRFTPRITAGGGWNQRVGYDTHAYQWTPHDTRIYGPRAYGEYNLSRGFSSRIELEAMNTFVPPFVRKAPTDPGGREWVWGAFVGMKKDYKFFKKLRGTTMIMFRLFDPERKSPYADVLNVRFGFELPMKKKPAKTSESAAQ